MTRGIIEGYENPDGTRSFRPHQPVTIAEFAKMLCLTLGLQWDDALPHTLSAQNNHWAYGYIARLEREEAKMFQNPLIEIDRPIEGEEAYSLLQIFGFSEEVDLAEEFTRAATVKLLYNAK